jgi:putative methyltransferase (TIGR04325 family)
VSSTERETFFRVGSWGEAKDQTKGYEDEALINSYVESIRQAPPWEVNNNIYFTDREIQLISAVQRVIAPPPPVTTPNAIASIRVLDVGGGNGYLGCAVQRFLPEISWEWIVVESNACANAYSQFEDASNIKWISHDMFDWKTTANIGLVSCSLQYLKYPEKELRRIAKVCDFIVLMRLPIVDTAEHIITRQTFYNSLHQNHDLSWPHWFLSRRRLFDMIASIGDVVYCWKTSSESYLFEGNLIILEGVLIKTHANNSSVAQGVVA